MLSGAHLAISSINSSASLSKGLLATASSSGAAATGAPALPTTGLVLNIPETLAGMGEDMVVVGVTAPAIGTAPPAAPIVGAALPVALPPVALPSTAPLPSR